LMLASLVSLIVAWAVEQRVLRASAINLEQRAKAVILELEELIGIVKGGGMSLQAAERARKMAEIMRSKGDNDGADTWLRIIVAIGELGQPATNARH
jgi:hypothetical protein